MLSFLCKEFKIECYKMFLGPGREPFSWPKGLLSKKLQCSYKMRFAKKLLLAMDKPLLKYSKSMLKITTYKQPKDLIARPLY